MRIATLSTIYLLVKSVVRYIKKQYIKIYSRAILVPQEVFLAEVMEARLVVEVMEAHLAVEVQAAVALQPNFNALCSFEDFWGSRIKKYFTKKVILERFW